MDPITVILLSVVFVMLLKLTGKSKNAKLIDLLPGPPGVPILGNALQFMGVDRADRLSQIYARDQKYGPIYRNWVGSLPYVHICSAELAEVVLGLKNIGKGQLYTFMQAWFGQGMLTAEGDVWTRSRKMITPTFHFQILESYLDTFRESSVTLIKSLKKGVAPGKPIDVYPYFTLAALDSICETAMGTKINAQENKESTYVKAICEMTQYIFYRYDRVWLHNDWLWYQSEMGKKSKKTLDILKGFTDKVIQERRITRKNEKTKNGDEIGKSDFGEKKKKAFLDLLLDACENENSGFSDKQLRDEVNTFMFEGHDTTTASLSFTMLALSLYPEIQEKVYQEQVAVLGTNQMASPSMHDLGEMKLLDRFIKETLRIYPPVPFISRKLLNDTKIGDYTIPNGSIIFISLLSILRDPRHFPEPEKFDPDRYLPDNSIGRHAFANIPFSAGPRNCIGQRFAMLEAKTFLSYIIRNFRIAPHTKPEELKTIIEIVQKPATPLEVKLYARVQPNDK